MPWSCQTTLRKNATTSFFGGASFKVATTSGTIADTYTTAMSTHWVMAAIAFRRRLLRPFGIADLSRHNTSYAVEWERFEDGMER